MNVNIDKDIVDFLRAIYFGDCSKPYCAASNRAYLDMNRTIRFHSLDSQIRMELKATVTELLEKAIIRDLLSGTIDSQIEYDSWHKSICDNIRNLYREAGIEFTYGQAQKWVNMTIKYLYMLEVSDFKSVFKYLHIPLDNYVFDVAKNHLKIERPKIAWSRWDDYEEQYLYYQKRLREIIVGYEPLRWEFRFWLKAARNME